MQPEKETWVVAGASTALAHLAPLIEAHSRQRPVRVVEREESSPLLPAHLTDAAAVLLIGHPRRSPRTVLPGIFLRDSDGRRIPAGWLPDAGDRLAVYARAAAEVQLRCPSKATPDPLQSNPDLPHLGPSGHVRYGTTHCGPFVLLGEFEHRALEWAGWFCEELPPESGVFQWTAERISRRNLIPALQSGAGAAFYFGRGTPYGWFGYGGFDKSDAAAACNHPLGCIVSFCCSVAARPRRGYSFCEELALSGLCAAAIGSTRLSLHHRNVEWSLAFSRQLRQQASRTLTDLLTHPCMPLAALNSYRILGDPMALLVGDSNSHAKCQQVSAPAPGEALPVIPLE